MVKAEEIKKGQYVHYKSRDVDGNKQDTWGYVIRVKSLPNFFLAEIKPDKGNVLSELDIVTNLDDILKIIK